MGKRMMEKVGLERHNVIVDMMNRHWQHLGYEVHVIKMKHSLLDKFRGQPTGDRFYIYKDGVSIVVRPFRRPIDIMVYRNGQLLELWEITNYKRETYMTMKDFLKYIDNLSLKEAPYKYLVVSYPENFRHLDPYKTEKENISFAETKLKEKSIDAIYWGKQSKYENYVMQLQNYLMKGKNESYEIKGWQDIE